MTSFLQAFCFLHLYLRTHPDFLKIVNCKFKFYPCTSHIELSLSLLAVTLSVSVLFTTCPDLPETFSVLAAEEAGQSETETRYVSAFAALPDEVREQTVPVGTALSELSLPDTLEAVVTGEFIVFLVLLK